MITSSKGSQILALDELDAGSSRRAATIPGHSSVSPDGCWLAIHRPFSTSLYVYRLPGLEQIAKLTNSTGAGEFAFSPSGDQVVVTSMRVGSVAEFWSTTTWERTRAVTNVTRILYTPDARALWLTKDLRSTGLYAARTLDPLLLLPTGMLPLALSPDGGRVAVKEFFVLALVCGAAAAFPQSTSVKVNRTVPDVKPPKAALEFSANPTTQEIFRARVFEEPRMPTGIRP